MKKPCFIIACLGCLITVLSSFSCNMVLSDGDSSPAGIKASGPELTIISWNLQTFFDAVDTGEEYEDFTGVKSSWTEDKYRERLTRVCSFIASTEADIYCFMEVENEGVVHDISNMLQLTHTRSPLYPYAAFCRDNTGSIGCAVLSRIPLERLQTHSAQFRCSLPVPLYQGYETGIPMSPPAMRPLMELTLPPFAEGEAPIKLFVNHWKSKSSGGRESELWRSTQESVLSRQMEAALAEGYACIAVGDFNRDLNEFYWTGAGKNRQIELRSVFSAVIVKSPWFESTQEGTYYFDENWSRIDHVFTAGNITVSSFDVMNRGDLVTDSGYPNSYSVWTGKGFSDHFPLKVKIQYTID